MVSRDKSLAKPTVYLYASRRVANIEDYRRLLTIKPIKFSVGLIDSLGLDLIIKVFLLFFYMPYEQRFYDVMMSESRNLHLKKRHPGCGVRMWSLFARIF